MYEDFGEEEENQNAIVDCDILEAAKENIQPLASGRRVTALASVLKTPHQLRNARLEATRSRFRGRVKEAQERVDRLKLRASSSKVSEEDKGGGAKDKGEDVETDENDDKEEEFTLEEAEEALLDTYVRLVTWTIEHYPRGQSAHSGILELLEEATRVMSHSEYARADPRYLNLWIRYGTYVDHPEVIYEFLLANEIGAQWAKLYEEYATILEKIGRRPKADEIYLLGIARKAEPLDHLERRHCEFQKRMMVAAPVSNPDPPSTESATTPATSDAPPRRRVLAESDSTSTTSASTPLTSTSSTFDVFSAQSSSSSLASQGSQIKPRASDRIRIFVDPTGEAEKASGNIWPELQTRAERIKENRRPPEKMQGAILEQRGAAKAALREVKARARAAPKFTPYKDPEPSEIPVRSKFEVFKDPEPPVATASSSNSADLANVAPGPSSTFEVFKDPEPPANGSKFVPFRDPECGTAPGSKIVTTKDPDLPAASSNTRRSKIVPLKDVAPAPRRSARLNPKLAEKKEPEPVAEVEEARPAAKTAVPSASFVPFRDADASQVPLPMPAAPATANRPKTTLGVAKGTSEAEALRKDPFKNYKDL